MLWLAAHYAINIPNITLNGKSSYEQKRLSEKELAESMIPYAAHTNEIATVALNELGFEPTESDYKIALKRI
jgi:hypothetical protein